MDGCMSFWFSFSEDGEANLGEKTEGGLPFHHDRVLVSIVSRSRILATIWLLNLLFFDVSYRGSFDTD